MSYDDRSVKPMSASLMRARIATKILSELYEDVPTMLTSAIRLNGRVAGWGSSFRTALSVHDRGKSRLVQRSERGKARGNRKARSGVAQSVDYSDDGL